MKEKFKVDIELTKPKFAYKETIRKKAQAQGKHKKQSGGHGQYGDVVMEFEPSGDLETPYIFEEKIVGGAVPKNYFPAVEKGIQECTIKGPLAGYPVVGVKATLIDGSYHTVDSSEMAFKTAATLAFKNVFMNASPVLLEPISTLTVVVPEKFTGDVMGDLNKKRGRVLGMNPLAGGITEVIADIPSSELFGYSTRLKSITGGTGDFSYVFAKIGTRSQEAQLVKNPPANAGSLSSIPGLGRSLKRGKWLPTPIFLPGEFHGLRSLMCYSSWGCRESDMIEQLTLEHSGHIQVNTHTYTGLPWEERWR